MKWNILVTLTKKQRFLLYFGSCDRVTLIVADEDSPVSEGIGFVAGGRPFQNPRLFTPLHPKTLQLMKLHKVMVKKR